MTGPQTVSFTTKEGLVVNITIDVTVLASIAKVAKILLNGLPALAVTIQATGGTYPDITLTALDQWDAAIAATFSVASVVPNTSGVTATIVGNVLKIVASANTTPTNRVVTVTLAA